LFAETPLGKWENHLGTWFGTYVSTIFKTTSLELLKDYIIRNTCSSPMGNYKIVIGSTCEKGCDYCMKLYHQENPHGWKLATLGVNCMWGLLNAILFFLPYLIITFASLWQWFPNLLLLVIASFYECVRCNKIGPSNPIIICILQTWHLGHMQTVLCWDYVIVVAYTCELYCCMKWFSFNFPI
jgi:hypothetical protein